MRGIYRKGVFYLVLAYTFLTPFCVLAEGENEVGIQQPVDYPSMGELFFRVLASLIVIFFLTYLIARILKRQLRMQQNQKSWMRILDYQQLGQNRGIYLLEILEKIYLVGITDGSINILKELDQDNESWSEIKDSLEGTETIVPSNMKSLLNEKFRFFNKRNKTENSFKLELKQQLNEQLSASHRLYNKTQKEDDDGKK